MGAARRRSIQGKPPDYLPPSPTRSFQIFLFLTGLPDPFLNYPPVNQPILVDPVPSAPGPLYRSPHAGNPRGFCLLPSARQSRLQPPPLHHPRPPPESVGCVISPRTLFLLLRSRSSVRPPSAIALRVPPIGCRTCPPPAACHSPFRT